MIKLIQDIYENSKMKAQTACEGTGEFSLKVSVTSRSVFSLYLFALVLLENKGNPRCILYSVWCLICQKKKIRKEKKANGGIQQNQKSLGLLSRIKIEYMSHAMLVKKNYGNQYDKQIKLTEDE